MCGLFINYYVHTRALVYNRPRGGQRLHNGRTICDISTVCTVLYIDNHQRASVHRRSRGCIKQPTPKVATWLDRAHT
jgi:hypothetical protein